jgi:hypothetical protein
MSRCLLVSGAPLAAPFASSQECHTSLWDGRLWRLTPGALSAVAVSLSLPVGGRT